MKIAILDDYQDSVCHLDCYSLLDGHEVKIFTNGARGVGQLAIRLASFDVLVLIRERTVLSRQLLEKLPNLKLIAQTGKVSGHIDLAAAAARNIVITEGVGDPDDQLPNGVRGWPDRFAAEMARLSRVTCGR